MKTIFLIFLIFFLSFFLSFIIFIIFRFKKNFSFECNHIKNIREPKLEENKIIFRDGYKTAYKKNIFSDSKNIFILFHGLNSSSNSFKLIQKFFKNINESVINFDQRNWGKNRITNCYHLGTLRDDCYDLIQLIKKKYTNKQIVLIGHSMGALMLSLLFKKYINLDKNIKFILINYPSKYLIDSETFFLNKENFLPTFFNGIIFNKKIILKHFNHEVEKKYTKNQLIDKKDFYIIRKLPFYFFLNIIHSMFIFKKNINIEIENKILIFLGSKDEFTDWKIIERHNKIIENKNKKNIKLVIIKDMKHMIAIDMENVNILFHLIYKEFKKLN